jgi:antitoxin ParD1/3/4
MANNKWDDMAEELEKRTISLPGKQASYIDSLVASGGYASASEVVRAGLRALQERDAMIELWLREKVVPAYDAVTARPETSIPADKVFANIRAHHARQTKKKKRNA